MNKSMINELAKQIHENNKSKGFYDDEKNIGEMIALMHSELSEALEADRNEVYCGQEMVADYLVSFENNEDFKSKYSEWVKGTFEEEMADIVIRVLDMCAYKGIDIEAHVKAKMRYNSLRPHKHGKKY